MIAKRRVQSGAWLRLVRGIYALPGNPPTRLRQMKAAELSVPGSAVSGTGAAVLHGLPDVRLGRLELTAPRGAPGTRLATVRRRHPVPVTQVEGIRTTTVAQTLADLAGRVDHHHLSNAIDAALLHGKVQWSELVDATEVARWRRARGAGVFAAAVSARGPDQQVASSVLESRLYAELHDPRLPPHLRQAPAPWAPDGSEVVDALFPTTRWIVEGEGRSWHARVGDFERDRARDHAAQRLGWGVSRFTYAQVLTPGYVVETLLRAFAARRAAA